MHARLVAVCFEAREPDRLVRFWGGLLGREVATDPFGPLLPGTDTQVGVRFLAGPARLHRPNAVHLHLTSDPRRTQEQTVASALGLGAAHLDVGQTPEEGHVVLADPEGNELCVIRAGSTFLAGTGFLGEVAGDGSREVGVFWSRALGWPLVWDEDGETAVQSPAGGTKLAWGGGPVAHRPDGARQQPLEVMPDDGDGAALVRRLLGLGARHVGRRPDGVTVLADPDGTAFRVLPG